MKKLIGGVQGFGSQARPCVANARLSGYLRLVDPCLTGEEPEEWWAPDLIPRALIGRSWRAEPVGMALLGGRSLAFAAPLRYSSTPVTPWR